MVYYAGCPEVRPCLKMGSIFFFFHGSFKSAHQFITRHARRAERVKVSVGYLFFSFFFVVASNLHINLCIKLCSLLAGIYYLDCLQQKRPNQNPLSARISRRRGPTHPFLCDVKSSFGLFIKPGLNSTLS